MIRIPLVQIYNPHDMDKVEILGAWHSLNDDKVEAALPKLKSLEGPVTPDNMYIYFLEFSNRVKASNCTFNHDYEHSCWNNNFDEDFNFTGFSKSLEPSCNAGAGSVGLPSLNSHSFFRDGLFEIDSYPENIKEFLIENSTLNPAKLKEIENINK